LVKTAPAHTPNLMLNHLLSLPGSNKCKGQARALGPPNPPTTAKGRSALATFTRSKSFAPSIAPAPEDPCASTSCQPFPKAQSLFLPRPTSSAQVAPGHDCSLPQIFAGMRFRVRTEARSASVRSAIEGCGGTWIEEDEQVDFVIVRLVRCTLSHLDS